MESTQIQEKIKKLYQDFFNTLSIINKTGELVINNHFYKFATYPFIGSNYVNAKKRILFVGLDIGADETPGYVQSFKERSNNIETYPIEKKNPHIAGTYISALYFLKDEYDWEKEWNLTIKYPTCQQALKYLKGELSNISPLSNISLVNYFKFVDKGRDNRAGNKNRKYINELEENKLFIEEIKLFQPDLLIFQSLSFQHYNTLLAKVKELKIETLIAPHPAYREKEGRQPSNYINKIYNPFK